MQSSSGASHPHVRRLKVAVVGSGPAGLYTAEALVKQAALLPSPVAISVDVLDRLPTPYGLVRYGVAPDHKSIKSVANYLRRVLESPGVTFVGGVHFGTDVTREDLVSAYDAVVRATGAMRDRRLGIPGEELPGSHAATDFVNWYCGHPDVDPGAFTLDAESVAVIGVGNVAVDVARILARDPAELEETDIPEPVMEALRASKVPRGARHRPPRPAQAKFTTKELRELGELGGVHVSADPTEPTWPMASTAPASRPRSPPLTAVSAATWSPWRTGAASPLALGASCDSGSGCARRRFMDHPQRCRVFASNARALARVAHSRGRASSRPSTRSWSCAVWATSPCRCPVSRSTSGRTPSRTPAAASFPVLASRCRASTWPAGSSADRPA